MRVKYLFMILAGALSISSVFAEGDAKSAQTAKTSTSQITSEQREKMANMHEKMSACLRSDKPISECHKEMRTDCQAMMDKEGCPMMGEMGGTMGPGMMRQHGMSHEQHEKSEETRKSK